MDQNDEDLQINDGNEDSSNSNDDGTEDVVPEQIEIEEKAETEEDIFVMLSVSKPKVMSM